MMHNLLKCRGVVPVVLGSLLAACMVYASLQYAPLTLVLKIRSFERGTRQVIVADEGGGQVRIPFTLGGDAGIYTIELPRKLLRSVTIPPLASPGGYEIEEISLGNDTVSYHWNGAAECRSRRTDDPAGDYVACAAGSPTVGIAADSTVTIARLGTMAARQTVAARAAAAGLTALLLLFSGLYLLRPVPVATSASRVYGVRAGWLLVIALYLWQCVMLWRYAVDLPFWEEWEFFEPAALQRGLTLDWLFCHFGTNQQVVVFTKLMAWLDFKLFSLDFVKLKLMNYLVFGLFLVALTRFARQVTGGGFRLMPLFLLFLVSPLAYEAHAASFQSGEIFVLLFSTGMLCYAVADRPGYRGGLLFSLCSLGAIFSMHTGVAVAAILLVCRTVFMAAKVVRHELDKKHAAVNLLISWLITVAGIIYWLSGFNRSSGTVVPRLLPTEGRFWDQFLNLLSYGFGVDSLNVIPGMGILLFLLLPVFCLLVNKHSRWEKSTWEIMQAITILLALAAMITFGRGGMFTTLKLSRYTVYISPLILFGGIAWWLLLKESRVLPGLMAAYLIFCFAAFSDNWDYAIYRDMRQMDLMNIDCVANYNRGTGDGTCPGTHGVPIGGFFNNARTLDIHFTRRFPPQLPPK